MKNSIKLTFCGIIAALITVLMAASLVPNITFAVPAIAGLLIIPVFAEVGLGYSVACFFVSAALSYFISDKTSFVLYLALFGYYPIIKPYIEKIDNPVLKWALKLMLFNSSALGCYAVEVLLFALVLKGWVLAAVFALGNIAFVLYDIAVSRIALLYYLRLHDRVAAILKKR